MVFMGWSYFAFISFKVPMYVQFRETFLLAYLHYINLRLRASISGDVKEPATRLIADRALLFKALSNRITRTIGLSS